jgi:hypothetical protein
VPIWPGTRPYQQIPFQWSCHVERAPDEVKHYMFLETSGNAPMQTLAESMLETLGDSGPIFAHNAGFEKSRIAEIAEMLPKHSRALLKLVPRFVDTLTMTKAYYYHPAMMGSWSLKMILPTIAPELDYENLGEVKDGGAASAAFQEIISDGSPPERKAELRDSLERYCERDTLALVRLVSFLQTGK